MNKSENISELAAALSKAQGELVGAEKKSKNPFYNTKYANLAACWEALTEPLSKNGLSVIQTTALENGHTVLVTTLMHSSGQFISGVYPLKPTKEDPQGLGSAVTYARRYALTAITGLYQEDDDGELHAKRPKSKEVEVGEVVEPKKEKEQHMFEECEHNWLPSKYNANQVYCSLCKAKKSKG